MENNLHTFTFHAADWELIVNALRCMQHTHSADATRIGLSSTYGALLYDESAKYQAIADDITFMLPDETKI